MKIILKSSAVLFSVLMMSCGGKEEKKKEGFSVDRAKTTTEQPAPEPVATDVKPSETVDLTNKGVGPITSLTLSAEVDQEMAKKPRLTIGAAVLVSTFLAAAAHGASVNKSIRIGDNTETGSESTVNGSISVGADAVVTGNVRTVNGSIRVDDGAAIEKATTVNGSVRLGDNVKSESLETVNGAVTLGSGSAVDGSVETVNGRISLGNASSVAADVSNVNGEINLAGAGIGGNVETRSAAETS